MRAFAVFLMFVGVTLWATTPPADPSFGSELHTPSLPAWFHLLAGSGLLLVGACWLAWLVCVPVGPRVVRSSSRMIQAPKDGQR